MWCIVQQPRVLQYALDLSFQCLTGVGFMEQRDDSQSDLLS
jgi:hypothetical protein